MKMVDWVTTTTPIFAKEIKKYNKNVFVSPNGIDPEIEQFKSKKEPSKNGKIRFGFIMGSSHEPDMNIMKDNQLAGCSAWRLGYESKDTWNVIKSFFAN